MKRSTQVLKILSDPDEQNRYITTAQVGITIASLGLGMYGEHTLAEWLAGLLHSLETLAEPTAHTIATVGAVTFLTYLHVVLGEMIPKSIALQGAEKAIIFLYRPMMVMERLFFPLVWILNHLANWAVRGFQFPDADSRLLTSEELEYIVEESLEVGYLEPSDLLFVENILDLEERTAEQAMTPRNKMYGIPASAGQEAAMQIICDSNKTRYPVYEENLDTIIGILHIKDFARYQAHNIQDQEVSLREILRPPIFIHEKMPLDELLIRFRKNAQQVAIVFDDTGGISGIITLEDLIEEVVGEIQDEFDEETKPIEELSPTLLRVRGDVILEELDQLYDLKLENEVAVTIGGLVMALLGRIPQAKDTINVGKVKIEVVNLDGLAVRNVLIHLPSKSSD